LEGLQGGRDVWAPLEVIVFDDCSKDRTIEMVRTSQRKKSQRTSPTRHLRGEPGNIAQLYRARLSPRDPHYRLVCGPTISSRSNPNLARRTQRAWTNE
jgi:glycosyltransferase involved in cell wall biosynthesis